MKIIEKPKHPAVFFFSTLELGQCFRILDKENELYIKVNPNSNINAVCFDDNQLYTILSNESIIPVDAKIVIGEL